MTGRTPSRPRGAFLADAVFGLVLLGVAALLLTSLLSTLSRQRRQTDNQQAMLHLAESLLERQSCRPWSELSQVAEPQSLEIPAEVRAFLPEASARLSVGRPADADAPGMLTLCVEVSWQERADTQRQVQLLTWVGRSRGRLP